MKINVWFLYIKFYILVRFIFVSMSHVFIFIYCYGFYLDLIGYSNFNFWLDFILIFYVYRSEFNILYAVPFIYQNLSQHCFPFSSFQGKLFLSPRTVAFFRRYHRWRFSFPSNLSISLSPTSVTTCSDRCYHRQFNPKPSYFHHMTGCRVVAVHEEASPNENLKWTAIHHRLLVPSIDGNYPFYITTK